MNFKLLLLYTCCIVMTLANADFTNAVDESNSPSHKQLRLQILQEERQLILEDMNTTKESLTAPMDNSEAQALFEYKTLLDEINEEEKQLQNELNH